MATQPTPLFDTSRIKSSPEVSAVSWVLETSTDPVMITQAADMVIDLQWPNAIDVRPHMNRLWELLTSCFSEGQISSGYSYWGTIRDGMHDRAIKIGCAYHTLRCVNSSPRPRGVLASIEESHPDLHNVMHLLGSNKPLILDNSANMAWILHVLPLKHSRMQLFNIRNLEVFLAELNCHVMNLNHSEFSSYLFCVYTFLADHDVSSSDMVCVNKSPFQKQLFEQLLIIIMSKLKASQITTDIVINVMRTTYQLTSNSKDHQGWAFLVKDRYSMIYQFCSSLPQMDGWATIVLATCALAENWYPGPRLVPEGPVTWIYTALQSEAVTGLWDSETQASIAGLLQALNHYDVTPEQNNIHLIIRAMSMGGNISRSAGLLLLKQNVLNWFEDPELGTLLQEGSIWALLSQQILQESSVDLNFHWGYDYIFRGHILLEIPDWQSYLWQELGSWMTVFLRLQCLEEHYISVLISISKPSTGRYAFTDLMEKALALTCTTLTNFWETFNFSVPSTLEKFPAWLRCTSLAVLRSEYKPSHRKGPQGVSGAVVTPEFKEAFFEPLRNSLINAATAARHEIFFDSSLMRVPVLRNMADILEDVTTKIGGPADPPKEEDHWEKLWELFDEKINKLEELLTELPGITAKLCPK
ncbi:hypothetical protein K438DRAFT_99190 [Mycena galopus ATCC 62051]|nr:hypothetical protein K438DRAFT_99190 [Mycena galopus ATCC 62051]